MTIPAAVGETPDQRLHGAGRDRKLRRADSSGRGDRALGGQSGSQTPRKSSTGSPWCGDPLMIESGEPGRIFTVGRPSGPAPTTTRDGTGGLSLPDANRVSAATY